jgi:starch synthase (maltosyl-transferring)
MLNGLQRVVIEAVEPQVDCGRFPIKRTVGEAVVVRADVYADGHDAVAAVVLFRKAGDEPWREAPMRPLDNDRWQGSFSVDALGRYEFSVEAWIDRFASWRQDLSKKAAAGQDVSLELVEGAALVEAAIDRARDLSTERLLASLALLQSGKDLAPRIAAAIRSDSARLCRSRARALRRLV